MTQLEQPGIGHCEHCLPYSYTISSEHLLSSKGTSSTTFKFPHSSAMASRCSVNSSHDYQEASNHIPAASHISKYILLFLHHLRYKELGRPTVQVVGETSIKRREAPTNNTIRTGTLGKQRAELGQVRLSRFRAKT
jgi:hypothetical protein